MARFFVGQRVRVVVIERPENAHLLNRCGVVTEHDDFDDFYGLDISPLEKVADPVGWHLEGFGPDQLEPILPEGHKPCEEDFKRDLDRLLEREGMAA